MVITLEEPYSSLYRKGYLRISKMEESELTWLTIARIEQQYPMLDIS